MSETVAYSLASLLRPRSVAVVGASDNPGKWGGRVLTYLVKYGFPGTVYPINYKYREVLGLPCYGSLRDLPEAPDVVALAVPAPAVAEVVAQCAERGVRNAVIITSGFAETGDAGRARQEEVLRLARAAGLRLVGPNCLGILNSAHRLPLTATAALLSGVLREGQIGFVSQSGALAGSFLSLAQDRGVGLRYMISTGNEADLELADFMDYLVDDPGTKVIAAFVEGVRDPAKFLAAAAKAAAANKPIVALKVGRSERGSRAARSHTSALTGADRTYDAVFKKYGIVRVDTFEGLLDTALLLAQAKLPAGEGIGVVTSSGGACGLVSDRSAELGVALPDLEPATAERVATTMGLETVQNPVDLLARQSDDSEALAKILAAFDADANLAVILALLTTMPGLTQAAQTLADYARSDRKPLVVISTAGSVGAEAKAILEQAGVPVLANCEEGLKAIRALLWRSRFVAADQRRAPPTAAPLADLAAIRARLQAARRPLTEPEAKAILAAYGIPVTREAVALNGSQAVALAREIGFPVALKIVSPDIAHKTEAGAVRLNLADEAAVLAAFDQIVANTLAYRPTAAIDGVLVQEMVVGGLETIAGVSTDPAFGPVVVFGLGGIFVELLQDVAARPLPFGEWDAREMVREIRSYRVLEGVRGQPPRDVAAIAEVLLALSRLVSDLSDLVEEIDLNPLLVLPAGQGVKVADALFVSKRRGS